MKKSIVVVAVLILSVVVGATLYSRNWSNKNSNVIHVSGNIEVTQVQLSFRLPGWVQERLIDEGQIVSVGQLAARLDFTELSLAAAQRKAAADSAKATLAALENGSRPEDIAAAKGTADQANAALAELLAGSRPQEIKVAEATLTNAQAQLAFAELDYKRMRQTLASGAVSQAQYDASQMNYNVAVAHLAEAQERLNLAKEGPRKEQIDQARAALEVAKQHYFLIKNGPRQEDIDQARARLTEAQSAARIAETQLSYATLNSPVSGIVLTKNVEAGEFVAAGTPIVTIGNLKDVWLRAYIDGPDLGKVKVGQSAQIRTDSYPSKTYAGHVSFISSETEFTPKSVQTVKERVKLVYRIKIDIDNPEMELKPGMPADADISIIK